MYKHAIWILIVLATIGLVAYSQRSSQEKENDTITIGGVFGLTGFSSTWGEADKNGAVLAIEEINRAGGVLGKILSLRIEDTQSDNTKTLSATTKLIEVDGVKIIIGPSWLDSFGSAAPLADSKDVIMITPSGAITAVKSDTNFRNVFSTWYRSDKQLQKFPAYLSQEGVRRVAVVISNDAFWEDVFTNFSAGAEESGVEILEVFRVNPKETDMRTAITRIKQLHPDGIFFGFSTEENLSAFLRQRWDIYPQSRIFTQESIEEFVSDPDFSHLVEGVRFIAPSINDTSFAQMYRDRFGIEPVFSASNSYDAVRIVAQALAAGNETTTELREYLLNNEFSTVTFGTVSFDEIGGVVGGDFRVKEVAAGGVVNDLGSVE